MSGWASPAISGFIDVIPCALLVISAPTSQKEKLKPSSCICLGVTKNLENQTKERTANHHPFYSRDYDPSSTHIPPILNDLKLSVKSFKFSGGESKPFRNILNLSNTQISKVKGVSRSKSYKHGHMLPCPTPVGCCHSPPAGCCILSQQQARLQTLFPWFCTDAAF